MDLRYRANTVLCRQFQHSRLVRRGLARTDLPHRCLPGYRFCRARGGVHISLRRIHHQPRVRNASTPLNAYRLEIHEFRWFPPSFPTQLLNLGWVMRGTHQHTVGMGVVTPPG